jgi:DNA sulfur modification protein DndD
VLVGAMNGHGKTSFLLALYLGLFGRYGLRHAEGFAHFQSEDISHYREAIRKFRRYSADPDEPTTIDLIFSPVAQEGEPEESEVRVVRRWFFTADGKPKQGDAFETLELYVNGRPQRLTDVDAGHARLERYLFPANFMPAFFFDGEQAQTLINNAAESGLKKSVEVLFGTKILEEVDEAIRQYINQSRNRIGGSRALSAQQKELDEKISEREKLESSIRELNRKIEESEEERNGLEKEQQALNERLSRLGGANKANVDAIQKDLDRANHEVLAAEEALTAHALSLGTALAMARLGPSLGNRLKSEQVRERWENLREGTVTRTDEVLQVALPEPPEKDELLGNISHDVRLRVRERFRRALEQIYHPPPDGCASEYLLGHVKGEMRERLQDLVARVSNTSSSFIQGVSRRLKQARELKQDAEARRNRLADLPREVQEIADKLRELTGQISESSRHLGSQEREVRSKRGILEALNAQIGKLQETLGSLGPDQNRIAIAERVHRTLDMVVDQLRPITSRRIQELVTNHFISVADRRYREGRVEFPDELAPVLRCPGRPDQLIEMMSGFERRAFGIAFSLALAEMTRVRVPLVIDTPMGNADTEYRPRLLRALTNVDLDQIIILTHDAEVTGELLEKIEDKVQQTFLVQYDRDKEESTVTRDAFF